MKKYSIILQNTTMGFGQSKPCPVCAVCEDCTDQLAECETCYDNRDDYCNDQVLGPLRSQNMKQLKQLQEDHETRLGKLDTQIIELEENEKVFKN